MSKRVTVRAGSSHLIKCIAATMVAAFATACGGGGTGASATAPSQTVPGAPAIGAVAAGNASASVAFAAPALDGGSAITGYTATCSSGGGSVSSSAGASPVTVLGLVNGTSYACTVVAVNAVGASAPSAALSVTPVAPIAPTVPAAPVINSVAAGNSSATVSFTAPSVDGGSAITSYSATCTASGGSMSASASTSPVAVTGLVNGTAYSCAVVAVNAVGTSASSAALSVTPAAPTGGGSGSTASVLCSVSGSEFNSSASVNLTATYSWSCTASSRVLTANGVPNHPVGTFPGPGNPNTIAAVPTSATYTLLPTTQAALTAVITSGYGINGVKMEPATAGTCSGSTGTTCNLAGGGGAWSIEALGQSVFNFGVDTNNAHVQPNGSYHYHGMPEGLITKLGGTTSTMTLIGWAPDGFPIYARNGYSVANSASSALKPLASSWRLKTAADTSRPSTATYPMGTFTQDYEYVAGLGDLDECNGRTGVTPEFPSGTYYYAITSTFPFIGRCVKGTPASIR